MAVQTSTIQIAIDEQIKENASATLSRFGMTISDAVRILLTNIAKKDALPDGIASDKNSYDAWFRAKVQEALDDPSPLVPHEQAMEEMQAIIDEKRHARSKMA
jgi:DNA-damage-inducible protein J